MAKYEIPGTPEQREKDLMDNIENFMSELSTFREKGKKIACSRARNSLNIIKKLITDVKRDLRSEADGMKKKVEPAAEAPAPEVQQEVPEQSEPATSENTQGETEGDGQEEVQEDS